MCSTCSIPLVERNKVEYELKMTVNIAKNTCFVILSPPFYNINNTTVPFKLAHTE